MESAISACPLVKGVVVFGQGQPRVGVLLEPRDVVDNEAKFINDVW